MSRSNPNENGTPNPAVRWFEWNGEHGTIRYYDKEKKETIDVGSDFTFLLLDQVGSVRGWHDSSDSGIYSNEVKDTTQDVLVVKSFKGGTLAEGLYRDIKDRVGSMGGQFVANCYIAFKNNGTLAIGSLRLKGAALFAWSEFKRKNRDDIFSKAIRIKGFTEGKKGKITYRVPVLLLKDVDANTNAAAEVLDKELQKFFAGYLKRPRREQADAPHNADQEASGVTYDDDPDDEPFNEPLTDDDIPF
jgi:hypothetical protein